MGFIVSLKNGPIAQRVEPPAHNRKVPGSIPGGPTIKKDEKGAFYKRTFFNL